jgi:chromosome segregation ATPase
LRKRKQDLVQLVAQANQEVQNLIRTKDDTLQSFHNNMPNAFREIQRRVKEFRDAPIGPLGMHVKLRDPKDEDWVKILEKMFGKNLNAFLVTNFDDRKKLESILQKYRWYSSFILRLLMVVTRPSLSRSEIDSITAPDNLIRDSKPSSTPSKYLNDL